MMNILFFFPIRSESNSRLDRYFSVPFFLKYGWQTEAEKMFSSLVSHVVLPSLSEREQTDAAVAVSKPVLFSCTAPNLRSTLHTLCAFVCTFSLVWRPQSESWRLSQGHTSPALCQTQLFCTKLPDSKTEGVNKKCRPLRPGFYLW